MSETQSWSLTDRVFRSVALAVIAACLIAFYAGGPMIGGVPLIVTAQALAIPYFVWAAWRLWSGRHGATAEFGLDLMLLGWTACVLAIVSSVFFT